MDCKTGNLSVLCCVCDIHHIKSNANGNGWRAEKIELVEETNEKYKEIDHEKLRQAMIAWVRETGKKGAGFRQLRIPSSAKKCPFCQEKPENRRSPAVIDNCPAAVSSLIANQIYYVFVFASEICRLR